MRRLLYLFVILFSTVAMAYSYHDDFNTLNTDEWLVYAHGGYHSTPTPPAYDKATIDNGVLKLYVGETDNGPELINKYGIYFDKNSVITASWRAKVHYANDEFAGDVEFLIVDYNTSYDPASTDYNIVPGHYYDESLSKMMYQALDIVYYRNYSYNDYPAPYGGDTFGMCAIGNSYNTGGCLVNDPIWDEWFTTKVELDLPNKTAKLWINDQYIGSNDINVSAIDFSTPKFLRIHFSPYGWFTGSEMDLDWYDISVTEAYNNPSDENITVFHKGWNLVGSSVNGDDFAKLYGDKPVKMIWKWDSTTKGWLFWSPDSGLSSWVLSNFGVSEAFDAQYLKDGYWVYATDDFELSR